MKKIALKLLTLAGVPALLLSGCRAEQVAFRFQPAPLPVVAAASAPVKSASKTIIAPASLATAGPVAATAAFGVRAVAPLARPRLARLRRAGQVRGTATPAEPTLAAAAPVAPKAAPRSLVRRLFRHPATEGAAESGLGRTVLFFVGVVLGVLAGLAALLSLIPGVSFWGGLGLAVGGLVGLGLLFKLLGGGGKKK